VLLKVTAGLNLNPLSVPQNGAPVEAEDDDGITPLHLAAMRGFPDCVEQLLAGKASVNQPDAEGMSALLYAAKKGSAECMQLVRH
jgi:ankyrin repeat protein